MSNEKYLLIPESIYKTDLGSTEILVYGLVLALSHKKGYCYAKNSVFESELKKSKPTIQKSLKKLIAKNYIKKKNTNGFRYLTPVFVLNRSKMIPEKIINDTENGIKNDTHNSNKEDNKKKDKLIDEFSLSSKVEDSIKKLLVKSLEHLNKRYLNVLDYKIKYSEYKHLGLILKAFKSYLGEEKYKSINQIDDVFNKYLFCFYLDYRNIIHKHRKRHYPYRFKDFNPKNFNYSKSSYKNEDYMNFKKELIENDDYDPNENSILNW